MSANRAIAARRGWCGVVAVIVLLVAGCSSPAPQRPRAVYVRLESLVTLHPSYSRLIALDRWAATARRASAEAAVSVPAPTLRTFVTAPGEALPLPPIDAVLARVNQVTAEELDEIAADLKSRMANEISRRAQEAAHAAEERIAPQRAAILRQRDNERRQILLDSRLPITNMRLEVANLQSQSTRTQVTAEQKAQIQTQLQEVQARLEAALKAQSNRLNAVEQKHNAQLATLDRAAQGEAGREVAVLRERLAQELEAELERERARLASPVTGAAEEMTAGLRLPPVASIVQQPGQLSAEVARTDAAVRRDWVARSRAMTRNAGELSALRSELADSIARDTRTTTEALARRHGLRVVWEKPARGSVKDITERAQKWVRDYWHAREPS